MLFFQQMGICKGFTTSIYCGVYTCVMVTWDYLLYILTAIIHGLWTNTVVILWHLQSAALCSRSSGDELAGCHKPVSFNQLNLSLAIRLKVIWLFACLLYIFLPYLSTVHWFVEKLSCLYEILVKAGCHPDGWNSALDLTQSVWISWIF